MATEDRRATGELGATGDRNDLPSSGRGSALDHAVQIVRQEIAALRYGQVVVIVQDGVVVQIDRTERRRLDRPPTKRTEPVTQ